MRPTSTDTYVVSMIPYMELTSPWYCRDRDISYMFHLANFSIPAVANSDRPVTPGIGPSDSAIEPRRRFDGSAGK